MERQYYKLDIGGIVYLVDPITAIAYTYDLAAPTEIGKVIWTDLKEPPAIEYRADWRQVLAAKLATSVAPVTPPAE